MTKQEALDEMKLGYTNSKYFDRFLKKIDRTSQSTLIEELFGSETAYIDTAGYYDREGRGESIVEFEEDNGYDVEGIWKWYCANFDKAWRWMFPLKNKT